MGLISVISSPSVECRLGVDAFGVFTHFDGVTGFSGVFTLGTFTDFGDVSISTIRDGVVFSSFCSPETLSDVEVSINELNPGGLMFLSGGLLTSAKSIDLVA